MPQTLYTKEHQKLVKRLIRAREKAKLSQIQVARLLNTSQPNISLVESGQRKIDALELKRFSKIYKQPISYFYE